MKNAINAFRLCMLPNFCCCLQRGKIYVFFLSSTNSWLVEVGGKKGVEPIWWCNENAWHNWWKHSCNLLTLTHLLTYLYFVFAELDLSNSGPMLLFCYVLIFFLIHSYKSMWLHVYTHKRVRALARESLIHIRAHQSTASTNLLRWCV